MMRALSLTLRDTRAAAGAEMALMLPMLLALLFGGMEGAHFMWSEHRLVKAVREGARFASRQDIDAFDCGTQEIEEGVATAIANVTRTASLDGAGKPKLPGWTDNSTVVATVAPCDEETATGIYNEVSGGARIVTVSATVKYDSLFLKMGFIPSAISLQAFSEAAVMGT